VSFFPWIWDLDFDFLQTHCCEIPELQSHALTSQREALRSSARDRFTRAGTSWCDYLRTLCWLWSGPALRLRRLV